MHNRVYIFPDVVHWRYQHPPSSIRYLLSGSSPTKLLSKADIPHQNLRNPVLADPDECGEHTTIPSGLGSKYLSPLGDMSIEIEITCAGWFVIGAPAAIGRMGIKTLALLDHTGSPCHLANPIPE